MARVLTLTSGHAYTLPRLAWFLKYGSESLYSILYMANQNSRMASISHLQPFDPAFACDRHVLRFTLYGFNEKVPRLLASAWQRTFRWRLQPGEMSLGCGALWR